jgi:5-methylthioribose kinase
MSQNAVASFQVKISLFWITLYFFFRLGYCWVSVAQFSRNVEMCRLTEEVIFTNPYRVAESNRWTSPHLDADAQSLREDSRAKIEIAGLKAKYVDISTQINADLWKGKVLLDALLITNTMSIKPGC